VFYLGNVTFDFPIKVLLTTSYLFLCTRLQLLVGSMDVLHLMYTVKFDFIMYCLCLLTYFIVSCT